MKQYDIKPLVMNIRERLMTYYKGDCVQNLTRSEAVYIRPVSDYLDTGGRRIRNFERWRMQRENKSMLIIRNVPILTMTADPQTVKFHNKVLNRSPQMRQVRAELEEFFTKYLPNVKVEVNDANSITYVD